MEVMVGGGGAGFWVERFNVGAAELEHGGRKRFVRFGPPGFPDLLMIGDGGFMMTISELETAVREDLPLVVCVMNDCAYGAELHVLRPRQLRLEKCLFPDIEFAYISSCLA